MTDDTFIARVLLLSDGRVVVPTERHRNSYICVVVRPRATAYTVVQETDLLAAKEIEV